MEEKTKAKKSIFKRWWFWVVVVVIVIGVIGSMGGNTSTQPQQDASTAQAEQTEPVSTDTTPEEPSEPADNMTMGQRNALQSAQSYLEYSAFSRSGLIEQLEFEGYSTEDATFAVDNCGANWTEQAEKSAQSYLEYSAFSQQYMKDLPRRKLSMVYPL